MSKITVLQEAITKLEQAEEALFDVRQAYNGHNDYSVFDDIFESLGDSAQILNHHLELEETRIAEDEC